MTLRLEVWMSVVGNDTLPANRPVHAPRATSSRLALFVVPEAAWTSRSGT